MVKNNTYKFHRILGFLISVLMVLNCSDVQVLAARQTEENTEGTWDGTWGGTGDGTDTTDGSDMILVTNETASDNVLASGTYYGMNWSVSKSGVLTVSGVYNENQQGSSWHSYGESITEAKITAVGVKSTCDWFRNLKNLKNVDLAGFDSGNVRNMNGMFYMCTALENIKWSNAKTYNVTDMGFMFYGCRKLETLDVSMFQTGKVTNMRYMFGGCSMLTELAVGGFDTRRVTDMTGMFYNCCNIGRLNVSNFNTAAVTDMSYMFADCYSLKTLDVSGFDTDSVTNMSSMFQNCSMLAALNLDSFDTRLVKHMSAMFYGCSSLTSLDVSGFDTSNVTNMTHMFSDCRGLEKIHLGNFSTIRVTNMDSMFYKCYKLKKLDLSSFQMIKVKSAENMLARCGALEEINTPTSLQVEVILPFTMQDTKGERYTSLPQNKYTSIVLQHVPYGIEFIDDQIYTGEAIKPDVVVVKDGETLTRDVDYKVYYKNNINVAEADDVKAPTVIVKGMGKYTGSFTDTFRIVAKELTPENTTVNEMIVPASNRVQTPRPTVMVDGRKLTFNKDYVVEYPDKQEGAYKEPGRYEVVVRGKCNYAGTYTTSMVILGENQINASELKVEKIPVWTYEEGIPATPFPKVTYKGRTLHYDEDYTLSYEKNTVPGKATVIVTGLENEGGVFVCGTLKKTFTIKGKPLSKVAFSYDKTVEYTGYGVYPEVVLTDGDKTLTPGVDYTVEYANNINVGRARIIFTGCGGYTGVVRKTFSIQPEDGVGDMLDISVGDAGVADYTRDGATPRVVVKLDNMLLQQGVDYKVRYYNNKVVAKANARNAPTAVIQGIGNYRFTRKETFTIKEKSLEDGDITITVADKMVGAANLRSKPVIKDSYGNTLKQGEDYTIVGYKVGGVDYKKNNIPQGATTAIVTVKGKGGYTGELSKMYRITKKSINKTNVSAKSLEYNGGSVEYTPEMIAMGMFVVTDQKTNAELVYGTDYEIIGYKNNDRRGSATVIIRGLGDYGGIRNVKFRIVATPIPL